MDTISIDDKRAWLVCIGCFWSTVFIHGVVRSSGVFYASIVDTWDLSREIVSWPFNLCMALDGFGVFLTGITSHSFIIRRGLPIAVFLFFSGYALSSLIRNIPLLILLIGLIGGLSQGYVIGSCYVLMCHYFLRYRTAATGIALAGSSVGGFTLPYLCSYLVEEYGLSGSFLLSAAVSLQGLIGAMICRLVSIRNKRSNREQHDFSKDEISMSKTGEEASCDPEKNGKSNLLNVIEGSSSEESVADCKVKSSISQLVQFVKQKLIVMKHPMFYIYSVSFTMTNFSAWTWLMIIVDFAGDRGLSHFDASFILSIASVCDFCGRVFYGWFVDYVVGNTKTALIILFFCISLNFFLMKLFYTLIGIYISSACFGFLLGCFSCNRAIIPVPYFGLEGMPSVLGLTGLLISGVSFLRPPLIGAVRDRGGSYDAIFLISGSMMCTGGALWLFEPFIMRFYEKKTLKERTDEDS